MPQLIRTPERIFREEKKDICVIRFKDGAESPARAELVDWLRANMPNAAVEKLAPSERSGFILGYFGDLRVNFSDRDLARYIARWETADGTSVDTRFQCYVLAYQSWLDRVKRYVPARERAPHVGVTRWIDTPAGVIYHQLSQAETTGGRLTGHPYTHADLLFNASEAWPELGSLKLFDLACGDIIPGPNGRWIVTYIDPPGKPLTAEKKDQLREWFSLPPDTPWALRCQ